MEQGQGLRSTISEVATSVERLNGALALRRRNSRKKAHIGLVDEFSLRRSSTLTLLRCHGHQNVLSFESVDALLAFSGPVRVLAGAILSVGTRSVTEPSVKSDILRLVDAAPLRPLVVLSDHDEQQEAWDAFRLGVRGYIPTTLRPCLGAEALRIVLAGGSYFPADMLMRLHRQAAPQLPFRPGEENDSTLSTRLPPRQVAVLRLVVMGKGNKEIAQELSLEESTVKVDMRHIMRKLGAENRTQAALLARRFDFLTGSETADDRTAPTLFQNNQA